MADTEPKDIGVEPEVKRHMGLTTREERVRNALRALGELLSGGWKQEKPPERPPEDPTKSS